MNKLQKDMFKEIKSDRIFVCVICGKVGRFTCMHQGKFKTVFISENRAEITRLIRDDMIERLRIKAGIKSQELREIESGLMLIINKRDDENQKTMEKFKLILENIADETAMFAKLELEKLEVKE